MSVSESPSEVVLELAAEFIARYRGGERPSLREYIERHPELAAEIREVFPAMAMMEKIALNAASLEGAAAPVGASPPEALQQLGDFRIIREVGKGGMGIVYEAEQDLVAEVKKPRSAGPGKPRAPAGSDGPAALAARRCQANDRATALLGVGLLQMDFKQTEAAERTLEQARAAFEALAREERENASHRAALARLQQLRGPQKKKHPGR
jgi:hypothetical protein